MTLWPDGEAAADVVERLMRSGVIVRGLSGFGVPQGVRISIGTPKENELLINGLTPIAREIFARKEYVLCQ
jgi:histidinol-phosphate aminotransferase